MTRNTFSLARATTAAASMLLLHFSMASPVLPLLAAITAATLLQLLTSAEDDASCLWAFQKSVAHDPAGFLTNWNFQNQSAGFVCNFNGVQCWHPGENKIFSLNLRGGGLSGRFPKGLSNCSSLQALDFSDNHFSGSIPSDLCSQLPYLTSLDLSQNKFTGPIPENMRSCSYLNELHLQQNQLDGSIPWAIGVLPRLRDLNLSGNNLSGPIPSSFTNRSELANKSPFGAAVFEGNPGLCGPPLSKSCSGRSSSASKKLAIAFIGASISILLVVAVLCYVLRTGRRYIGGQESSRKAPSELELFDNRVKLTQKDLWLATSDFSQDNVIGAGDCSTVYKGALSDGQIIAVKRMNFEHGIDEARMSFLTELRALGELRHRHLVKILGYFNNLEMMAVILEYMPNGSLERMLHGERKCELNWNRRFKIALGVAEGLAYLHHQFTEEPVIHGDLKPSNILLDADLEARIADFGVARIAPHTSHVLAWTIGYTAPERALRAIASTEADVFSFGVMLMELLTGERPTSSKLADGVTLTQWVGSALATVEAGTQVLDESLKDEMQWREEMVSVMKLADACTDESPASRPDMETVVEFLRFLRDKDERVQRFRDTPLRILAQEAAAVPSTVRYQSPMLFSPFVETIADQDGGLNPQLFLC